MKYLKLQNKLYTLKFDANNIHNSSKSWKQAAFLGIEFGCILICFTHRIKTWMISFTYGFVQIVQMPYLFTV